MTMPTLFAAEQFRMVRLQVFDWGTFSGIHDIAIAERGYLFVGRSGAGKSTLLDAFSALLVPPTWIDFNAAARESEGRGRDRSLVSYVRGAWAEQKSGDSGETATQFLRKGTTWSALALTYRNQAGHSVTLLRLFWLRGQTSGSADLQRRYLVFERELDLKTLESFSKSNFDVRTLKQTFPEAYIHEDFEPYRERFSRLLGLENRSVLRLLNKTQSAKNLGDLNTFLRDFMLDEPETFKVAQRLVSEFGELNEAHQAVVAAREQVQVLLPARARFQQMQLELEHREAIGSLQKDIPQYRELCRIGLLHRDLANLHTRARGLDGEVVQQQSVVLSHRATMRDLERERREAGGDQIEQWEAAKSDLERQRIERGRKRAQAEDAASKVGWAIPATPAEFAKLVGDARDEIESATGIGEEQEQNAVVSEKSDLEKAFAEASKDVEALQRQPSNIRREMLELRTRVAKAIGVADSVLPFAGELIQVRASEAVWQGVLERLLRGFAQSVLVSEKQYTAVAQHVNETYLGQRLVYHRIGAAEQAHSRPLLADSTVHKLEVKESPQTEWLRLELRNSFNYACVESGLAFRKSDRAVTREGQIKHSKTRHEKDDRNTINERRNWYLGFDNREKLALFTRQAQELGIKVAALDERYRSIKTAQRLREDRRVHAQRLVDMQWQEIDVKSLIERIAAIDLQIKEVREGSAALRQIGERIDHAGRILEEADVLLTNTKVSLKAVEDKIEEGDRKLEKLERTMADPAHIPLSAAQQQGLDERFNRSSPVVDLENLDRLASLVSGELHKEAAQITGEVTKSERAIEGCFSAFMAKWKSDSTDVQATLASAPDFFARLTRLETDNLPAYEEKFFDLLRNQSHQNLAALSTYLSKARKEIHERMELVNESLKQVPFNQSSSLTSYLRIDTTDRQLAEVREFKQELQQAQSHAWSDDKTLNEIRFAVLRQLVERLASQEPERIRWRQSVLDVRLHVEFIGVESGEDGAEIERYRSGAGKSGGQRQKLATTCLAAALRYQLGGSEHGVPKYAAVIMDEAFDKADNEFTTLAMQIFTNFGFQMIVATPLKSVMTLEPFIGGACFVDITDRHTSTVLLIEYDDSNQRLNLPGPARVQATAGASIEVS